MNKPLSPAGAIAAPRLWASAEIPFLPCGEGARELASYIETLLAWNRKLNLSGCAEALPLLRDLIQDSFFLASFLDELVLVKQWPVEALEILDLGAGAGLPGIPLRIFWPYGHYTWVERRQKRALFLQNICARLRLPRCSGFPGDAAAFFAATNQKAHCIISRAFMPWQKLPDFCAAQLAPTGSLIIMASHPPPAPPAGWQLDASRHCPLPARDHWLWALSRS